MNRAQRRAAVARQRRRTAAEEPASPTFDRASLLRLTAALVETDANVSGVTLIEPSGEITFIDAAVLRRGGSA